MSARNTSQVRRRQYTFISCARATHTRGGKQSDGGRPFSTTAVGKGQNSIEVFIFLIFSNTVSVPYTVREFEEVKKFRS